MAFWQNFLQTGRISLASVAENIMTCLLCGVWRKICCTSWRMSSFSSILSHSSMTKCLTLERSMTLSLTDSWSIRPGVPMAMCGAPLLSSLRCSSAGTPPKNTALLTSLRYLEKRWYSLWIWKASSRVWQSTTTASSFSFASSWCRVVRTKTAVLPMPDLAWQMMSPPRMACGMHSCWTSEGCSKPQSTIARVSSGLSKKSLKPELCTPT
mmetsp:Transcript_14874/g.37592  ORF Transcript_14874/g.37592 Transcript_14874/m.37592 type:complete len:210 (-) Transcript_14874:187-816(-)